MKTNQRASLRQCAEYTLIAWCANQKEKTGILNLSPRMQELQELMERYGA